MAPEVVEQGLANSNDPHWAVLLRLDRAIVSCEDQMNDIIRAAQFAEQAHRGQVRKFTGEPYIMHPMRVAGRVAMLPQSHEDAVVAAWLHDVVEDCGVTIDDLLRAGFRPTVVTYVQILTRDKSHQRKAEYTHAVVNCNHYWPRLIKILDRIDNLSDGLTQSAMWREYYRDQTNFLIRCIQEFLERRWVPLTDSFFADRQFLDVFEELKRVNYK